MKIKKYLTDKGEHEFLAACMITYYAFLRPKEIGLLESYMFNLKDQIIILPPHITKKWERKNRNYS